MRTIASAATFLLLGCTILQAETSVRVEVATDHQYYRESARNEIVVRADLASAGHEAELSRRNCALVLDRSGSMAGERIDALRKAVAEAINVLDPDDFVSITAFGSEVETIVDAQRTVALTDISARLASIKPAGGAALYDALNQAAAQLRRNATPGTINRLVLVTDGPATKGPREPSDFVRLAEAFSREGVLLSVVGLGDEFDEDLLADMARAGNGHFLYADRPERLADEIRGELTSRAQLLGADAEVSFEFSRPCDHVHAEGWPRGVVTGSKLTYRFPRLFAGQVVLAYAVINPLYSPPPSFNVATLRIRWRDVETGEPREISQAISIAFTTEPDVIRRSFDVRVARSLAQLTIREGLQKAIDRFDRSDRRRPWRELRSARSDIVGLNVDFEDAEILQVIRRVDEFLTSAQNRDMTKLDRKTLRSGLFNAFDPPTTDDVARHE